MKVRVKNGYTAFYGLKLRKPNEIVEIKEKVCPPWGVVIEADVQKKEIKNDADKMPTQQSLLENVQVGANVEEIKEEEKNNLEEIENKEDNEPYTDDDIDELSSLLDKAVELGIVYQPDNDVTIKAQIVELKNLLKDMKVSK